MKKFLLSFCALCAAVVLNAQTEVTFDFDKNATELFGIEGRSSGSNADYVADGEFMTDGVATVDGVTVTVAASAEDAQNRNRLWATSPVLRMYNGAMTVSAPGHNVTGISFNAHNSNFNISASAGLLDGKAWVADEKLETVVFTVAKNTQIKTMTVTLDGEIVADVPVFEPEGEGEGTSVSPYNVTRAVSIIENDKYTSDEVYVIGTVKEITEFSIQYGNATYTITDGVKDLLVYRGYGLGGEKFNEESVFNVGMTVILQGKLTNYKGTFEVATGSKIVDMTEGGKTPGADATYPVELTVGENNEVAAFAQDADGYTYLAFTATEAGKVVVKTTPNAQLFMDGKYLSPNFVVGGVVIEVEAGQKVLFQAKLTVGQDYIFSLDMQAPELTYMVRYNPDETVAVVFLTPGTEGHAINYGIGIPVLSETYVAPIAFEYDPALDAQGTGECTYIIIAQEEGSMTRVIIQVTVKKPAEAQEEEWMAGYTYEYEDWGEGAHMVDGALKVKCEGNKIVIKAFDGVEGYDLEVEFDEEDNVTSVKVVNDDKVTDATTEWSNSGNAKWRVYITNGYSYAGYDEEGGYVLLSAYVGEDWIYYYVAWDSLTVGVANVVKMEKGAMYDISGRRIEKAVKGQVFIKNGKKMIQK